MRDNTYRVISFQQRLKRPVDDVLCICQYDENKFYIGTSTGVVSMKYEKDSVRAISYIGQEHGLSNDMIHGILSDKNGFLWMSSNKGLNKYNPMNGRIHTFGETVFTWKSLVTALIINVRIVEGFSLVG